MNIYCSLCSTDTPNYKTPEACAEFWHPMIQMNPDCKQKSLKTGLIFDLKIVATKTCLTW